MKFIHKLSFVHIFIISILITLLSFIIEGTWTSPYPTISDEGIIFSENSGRGFPLLWWRSEKGLDSGTISMPTVIASTVSFIGDIIIWFIILAFILFVIKKLAKR